MAVWFVHDGWLYYSPSDEIQRLISLGYGNLDYKKLTALLNERHLYFANLNWLYQYWAQRNEAPRNTVSIPLYILPTEFCHWLYTLPEAELDSLLIQAALLG